MTVSSLLFLNRSSVAPQPQLSSRHSRALHSLVAPPASPPASPDGLDLSAQATPRAVPRTITPNNQVLGGLLLHQTRATAPTGCVRPLAVKLAYSCSLRRTDGTPLEQLGSAGMHTSMEPFGADPVFDTDAPQYSAPVARNAWQYYNATAAAGEVGASGLPRAFFPRPLPGHSDGFPVVMPVRSPRRDPSMYIFELVIVQQRGAKSRVYQHCGKQQAHLAGLDRVRKECREATQFTAKLSSQTEMVC